MNLDPSEGLAVFTDGSAYTKDQSGGWAWVALDAFEGTHSNSGYYAETTINRMELYAPTRALVSLYGEYGSCSILVYSDSEYVVLGMNARSNRKRVKNLDWWADLEEATALHELVEYTHVKGHAGNRYNDQADKLAGKARKNEKASTG